MADGCRVRVIAPDELDDDQLVISSAMMGAPTVVLGKIPSWPGTASRPAR